MCGRMSEELNDQRCWPGYIEIRIDNENLEVRFVTP